MFSKKRTALALGLALAIPAVALAQMGPGNGYNGYGQMMPWGQQYQNQGQPWGPQQGYMGQPGYMMGQPGYMGPGYMGQGYMGQGYMGQGNMGPGYMGYGMQGPNAPGRGRFAMADANEDGVVTAEEAASQADLVFTGMDANDDGYLTLDEYMTIRLGPQDGQNPDFEAMMQARKQDRFDPMDTDGDGKVSKEEFMAQARTHFQAAGTGPDGTVTPWSFRNWNWN